MKFENSEEALLAVAQAAEFFGWEMSILSSEDPDAEIPGIIIGKETYINDLLDGKYKDLKDESQTSQT